MSDGTERTPDSPASAEGADLGRRRFFRQFASELIQTAATVAGAASALQRSSAEAASAILESTGVNEPGAGATPGRGVGPGGGPDGGPSVRRSVFRTAFRFEEDALVLLDQRRLPDELVEVECRTAAEVAHAIRERVIRGAPAIGQAAALGLALAAHRMREARAYARRATLRGSANALINARPTSITIRAAVDRMLARYEAVGDLTDDGAAVADALRAEADAIVFEATTAHGRIAELGLAELPGPEERPLRILTLGNSGVLGGGQYGTALGIVLAAAAAGRELELRVCETRPLLQGARLTTWELANAGVAHTLIADAAAGALVARGEIDLVLVAADRVAANGDIAAIVGTYPLALLAARHGLPFLVAAPLCTVDLATADGRALPIEERPAHELLRIGATPIAPAGTRAANPLADITPGELISAIVTEAGVLRAPFEPALRAAVEAAEAARARRTGEPIVLAPSGTEGSSPGAPSTGDPGIS